MVQLCRLYNLHSSSVESPTIGKIISILASLRGSPKFTAELYFATADCFRRALAADQLST
jgi:hypothetical protein